MIENNSPYQIVSASVNQCNSTDLSSPAPIPPAYTIYLWDMEYKSAVCLTNCIAAS